MKSGGEIKVKCLVKWCGVHSGWSIIFASFILFSLNQQCETNNKNVRSDNTQKEKKERKGSFMTDSLVCGIDKCNWWIKGQFVERIVWMSSNWLKEYCETICDLIRLTSLFCLKKCRLEVISTSFITIHRNSGSIFSHQSNLGRQSFVLLIDGQVYNKGILFICVLQYQVQSQ